MASQTLDSQHDNIFKTLQNHIQLVSTQINGRSAQFPSKTSAFQKWLIKFVAESSCVEKLFFFIKFDVFEASPFEPKPRTKQYGASKREDTVDFNRETYWNNVGTIFKVLSMEVTKISLAFSKQPFPSPKNTEALVHELEKSMLALVSIYYTLPLSQGVTLRGHFKQAVLHVLDNLDKFVSTLSDCINSKEGDQRQQWTGGVWEAASLELIKDNKTCVAEKLRETYELVDDALQELEEACSNEGVDVDFDMEAKLTPAEAWSEQDKTVVNSCTGLVKTMKNVMKKTQECVSKNSHVETQEGINTLDELAKLTCGVSSVVDDFVSAIYVPLNYTTFVENGTVVAETSRNILKFLRDSSLTKNDDEKWLDFLLHACDHNLDKLKSSTLIIPESQSAV